jgi:hypothetical protein
MTTTGPKWYAALTEFQQEALDQALHFIVTFAAVLGLGILAPRFAPVVALLVMAAFIFREWTQGPRKSIGRGMYRDLNWAMFGTLWGWLVLEWLLARPS